MNLFAEAESLVDKILSCPRIKLSNSQSKISDGIETGVLLSHFAQQLNCGNANCELRERCGHSFYLRDVAGVFPSVFLKGKARVEHRGGWVNFKIKTSEAAELVHAVVLLKRLSLL